MELLNNLARQRPQLVKTVLKEGSLQRGSAPPGQGAFRVLTACRGWTQQLNRATLTGLPSMIRWLLKAIQDVKKIPSPNPPFCGHRSKGCRRPGNDHLTAQSDFHRFHRTELAEHQRRHRSKDQRPENCLPHLVSSTTSGQLEGVLKCFSTDFKSRAWPLAAGDGY